MPAPGQLFMQNTLDVWKLNASIVVPLEARLRVNPHTIGLAFITVLIPGNIIAVTNFITTMYLIPVKIQDCNCYVINSSESEPLFCKETESQSDNT